MPRTIGVAVADFNEILTREMERRAVERIRALGHEVGPVVHVAGSWDLPFACAEILRRRGVDGVVAIGAIVTGETKHDEAIGHAAASALLDVALAAGKPVGLGVTGPGQTFEQARDRIDRAEAAVEAVVQTLDGMAGLRRRS